MSLSPIPATDHPLAEQAHRQAATPPKQAVLLVNLGTPDAPTPSAIRRYLAEFLWDKRVVDVFRPLWWLILNAFILTFRPRRLAHSYAGIWGKGGSPLLTGSQDLAQGLAKHLEQPVLLAMRYGQPSLKQALDQCEAEGIRHLKVLPLYPQYSATTTASALDGLFLQCMQRRWVPQLRTYNCYHDHPAYIAALATSIRRHWAEHGQAQHLLLSFHGIPQRYFLSGDPYHCHCLKTARLVAEALALPKAAWSVSFQSRFGREPWLQPYTDERIAALARDGVAQLDVICPGFAVDCLETLEEIAISYREVFIQAGGQALRYIPALNAQPEHIEALADILAD